MAKESFSVAQSQNRRLLKLQDITDIMHNQVRACDRFLPLGWPSPLGLALAARLPDSNFMYGESCGSSGETGPNAASVSVRGWCAVSLNQYHQNVGQNLGMEKCPLWRFPTETRCKGCGATSLAGTR